MIGSKTENTKIKRHEKYPKLIMPWEKNICKIN